MKPTQVYIGERARAELATLAKKRGVAMADLIREGIDAVLAASRSDGLIKAIDQVSGMWADRDDIKDGISYEDDIRRSPHCFSCRSVEARWLGEVDQCAEFAEDHVFKGRFP